MKLGWITEISRTVQMCYGWFQDSGMVLYSSLNIGWICYKEKHQVNSLDLNRSKDLCNLFSWVEMQRLMTWWHDDMMQCTRCKDECNRQNKSHDETWKSWKAPEAPVLARHTLILSWSIYFTKVFVIPFVLLKIHNSLLFLNVLLACIWLIP